MDTWVISVIDALITHAKTSVFAHCILLYIDGVFCEKCLEQHHSSSICWVINISSGFSKMYWSEKQFLKDVMYSLVTMLFMVKAGTNYCY